MRKVIKMNWQNIIKSKEARRLADIAEDNGLSVIKDRGDIEMLPSKYASTKFTFADFEDKLVFHIQTDGSVFYRDTEFDYDNDEEFVKLVKRYIEYIETDRTRISRDNPSEGQMIRDTGVEEVAKYIVQMLDIDELEEKAVRAEFKDGSKALFKYIDQLRDIKMSIEEEFDL